MNSKRVFTLDKLMMTRICLLLLMFFIAVFNCVGQDSIALELKVLGFEDVNRTIKKVGDQEVLSASRTLKQLDEVPFPVYVVTKEDILKNGYVTLGDVLKHVPGIRVSQPGSALEGETFMMRGLIGNTYTKILINDQPIKPSVVRGMPIGAQLPIKQAERIEIIFGPAAVVYGTDASAGVINIILKESDRPIFTQADLSVGSYGYSGVDVMFGGKLGRNKRVLNYTIFGSNTVYNHRPIYYDNDSLYNPFKYLISTNIRDTTRYTGSNNYEGTAFSPTLNDLPHLSRMFGANLRYKEIGFSYLVMYRRDHSAIGSSPLALSYANPLGYTGEEIHRFNFNWTAERRISSFKLNTDFTYYEMDNLSSIQPIHNSFRQVTNGITTNVIPTVIERDSIRDLLDKKYFNGRRFQYANNLGLGLEFINNIKPWKFIEFTLGTQFKANVETPYVTYFRNPFDFYSTYQENRVPLENLANNVTGELSAFAQTFVTFNRFNISAGLQVYTHSNWGTDYNLRIAGLYKLNNDIGIRGSYGTAFRVPSSHYTANTYQIRFDEITNAYVNQFQLVPEKTSNLEAGIRWNATSKIFADFSFFRADTENFISYTYRIGQQIPIGGEQSFTLGYLNDEFTSHTINGFQLSTQFTNIIERINLDCNLHLSYNYGNEQLARFQGEIDVLRGQPKFLGQFRVSFKPISKIYIVLDNTYLSESVSRRLNDQVTFGEIESRYTNPGYYTLDLLVRSEISNNFQIYFKVNNFFNKEYAGIDATGFADDLFYNPQQQRTLRLGLNYTLN